MTIFVVFMTIFVIFMAFFAVCFCELCQNRINIAQIISKSCHFISKSCQKHPFYTKMMPKTPILYQNHAPNPQNHAPNTHFTSKLYQNHAQIPQNRIKSPYFRRCIPISAYITQHAPPVDHQNRPYLSGSLPPFGQARHGAACGGWRAGVAPGAGARVAGVDV
jgi:hypothetical protein